MAYLVGTIVGGAVGVFFFSMILEFFAYKSKKPTERAVLTAGTALIVCGILAGFAFANGDAFAATAWVNYVPGAALVFLWLRRRYRKYWRPDEPIA